MKAGGRLALASLAMVALPLLALAGTAAAKPGYLVVPESRLAIASLAGSNDYRITILANSRYVLLLASKRGSYANYTVRDPFRDNRINARLGKLGHIAVRFVPDGPPQREGGQGGGCKGRPSTSESGHFVGAIRFRGERRNISCACNRQQPCLSIEVGRVQRLLR